MVDDEEMVDEMVDGEINYEMKYDLRPRWWKRRMKGMEEMVDERMKAIDPTTVLDGFQGIDGKR